MKKAFVFDTNFIIENLNLVEVVQSLMDEFTVYVTQVSIDERISQKYLQLKGRYEKLANYREEYRDIANTIETRNFEEAHRAERAFTQQGYTSLFGKNIIPFSTNGVTFSKILDRVHKKLPPFKSVDGASDKGFKDSLLWVSVLEFFKINGEDEVIFVSCDNGFIKNSEAHSVRSLRNIPVKVLSLRRIIFISRGLILRKQKQLSPLRIPHFQMFRNYVKK